MSLSSSTVSRFSPLSLWAGDHCRDQEDAGTERHASSAVSAKGVKWTAWSEPWDPQAVGSRRRPKEGFAWYSDQNEWKQGRFQEATCKQSIEEWMVWVNLSISLSASWWGYVEGFWWGYVEGSLQKRSGAHSEEVPKEHGEGGQRLLYKGENEERLGLVGESNLKSSHHIVSICFNPYDLLKGKYNTTRHVIFTVSVPRKRIKAACAFCTHKSRVKTHVRPVKTFPVVRHVFVMFYLHKKTYCRLGETSMNTISKNTGST